MTQKFDTQLAELRKARDAAETAYTDAKAQLADGETGPEVVRQRREELRLIDDQIEGLAENRRRAEEAEKAAADAADQELRQRAHAEATAILTRREKLAASIEREAKKLGEDLAEFRLLGEQALAIVRTHMPSAAYGHMRSACGEGSFNSTNELLARELAAVGIEVPGLSRLTAISQVQQRSFVGWVKLRAQQIRDAMATMLSPAQETEPAEAEAA